MKRFIVPVICAAVVISAAPALAQHGHGMAGGQGFGHGAGGSDHSMRSSDKTGSTHTTTTLSDRLDRNPKLAANLQKLLPSGTTPQQACTGFKNLGQCVAAIHVSHNLGIKFDDLKAKMLGTSTTGSSTTTTTTSQPMSLGKAIQALKPTADAKTETNKANTQTKEDLKGTA